MRVFTTVPILALLSLVGTPTLSAGIMTWEFKNVTFQDGGVLSGTFDFDPDAGANGPYSNFKITTTAGSIMSGASYGVPTPFSTGNASILLGVPTDNLIMPPPTNPPPYFTQSTPYLLIVFEQPLSSAGGMIPIVVTPLGTSIEGTYDVNGVPDLPFRVITGGSVQAQTVPEPSSFAIVAVLLVVVGIVRHRRTNLPARANVNAL